MNTVAQTSDFMGEPNPFSIAPNGAVSSSLFAGIGLVDPRSAPYGAKLDGVTDDTAAFTKMHEAINTGAIRGYYVPATAKIKGNLPALQKEFDIKFFAGATLDFSENFAPTHACLLIEGTLGAPAELTANAEPGQYILSCATPYADGTILKIVDPTTKWDPAGTNTHPGELVEVGQPDGMLAGINGSTNTPEGMKAGEKITGITLTNLNPTPAGVTVWPAAGKIELGGEVYEYTSRELVTTFVKFTVAEKICEVTKNQGYLGRLVAEAGKVYLRIPISHEQAYTAANKSTVAPATMVPRFTIENPRFLGVNFGQGTVGIKAEYASHANIVRPWIENCLLSGIVFANCMWSHLDDPFINNSREINFAGGGNGYGINFTEATQDCSVRGGRTVRTRHSFTHGSGGGYGLPRRNVVYDHLSEAAFADAYDSHGGAADVRYIRCHAHEPNGAGFNMNLPKASIIACTVTRPGTNGVQCSNQTIGVSDYDIDAEVLSPQVGGITVTAASTTTGTTSRRIRIRGEINEPKQYAVQASGSGQGNAINWYLSNVDIDVQVANGPTETPYQAVFVSATKFARVRLTSMGVNKLNDQVRLRDVQQFVIDLGPVGWSEAGGTGIGCNVTVGAGGEAGGTTKGVVREGPMFNRGSNSTKLENTVTNVWIYPGPDENVSLGTGAGNQKVAVP
jgi:hypothetical protein